MSRVTEVLLALVLLLGAVPLTLILGYLLIHQVTEALAARGLPGSGVLVVAEVFLVFILATMIGARLLLRSIRGTNAPLLPSWGFRRLGFGFLSLYVIVLGHLDEPGPWQAKLQTIVAPGALAWLCFKAAQRGRLQAPKKPE
jgi:hypothetical protein